MISGSWGSSANKRTATQNTEENNECLLRGDVSQRGTAWGPGAEQPFLAEAGVSLAVVVVARATCCWYHRGPDGKCALGTSSWLDEV